jgi:hypothetical protein
VLLPVKAIALFYRPRAIEGTHYSANTLDVPGSVGSSLKLGLMWSYKIFDQRDIPSLDHPQKFPNESRIHFHSKYTLLMQHKLGRLIQGEKNVEQRDVPRQTRTDVAQKVDVRPSGSARDGQTQEEPPSGEQNGASGFSLNQSVHRLSGNDLLLLPHPKIQGRPGRESL